ncbi:MAG: DUF262 domain-containing protein, partial [Bacteroidota bacterium]
GSLLLLAKKPNLTLAFRSIEAVIREGYPPEELLQPETEFSSEVFYVLDGQQRTTSIARVFLNAHPRKTYYFDLLRMLKDYREESTSWIVARARGKTDPDRKNNNRLLRSDIILDQAKSDIYVAEYIEDSGDFPEYQSDKTEARKAASFIKGIFESIRNYQVPIVILERDTGIESVCRVFETINSTGTRLTTFDLAVARFFPTPDLRQLWEEGLDRYPILRKFEVDGERALQVLHMVRAARANRYAEPTRSDILALPSDSIEKEWNSAVRALSAAYEWAEVQGARPETLPNHGVLVVLASYNGLYGDRSDHAVDAEQSALRKWYFCKLIQAGASQAANYRIAQDFSLLRRFRENKEPLVYEDVHLNVDTILRLKRNDVRYKALLNLLAMTMRQDLISAKIINDNSRLDDHHIFPRAAAKKYGVSLEMLDGIANRIPLLVETNRSLGEDYPRSYFSRMRETATANGTINELSRRMADCLIPGNPQDNHWP